MDIIELFEKLKRASRKPPKLIFERLIFEFKLIIRRYTTPFWIHGFSDNLFLKKVGYSDINTLWSYLGAKPYFINLEKDFNEKVEKRYTNHYNEVLEKAKLVMDNKIELLGTGLISLGDQIDWHKDYKTNFRWEPSYIGNYNYSNPYDFNDVKIPWEISRLQWLIPVSQAYILTKEEIYAEKVKKVISSWINENPYASSINWACTMEAALRVFTLTWYFYVFKNSKCWNDSKFRCSILKSIWLHGKFTEEHLEKSDVNGNHYTADAAGLVIAGLFFDICKNSKRWSSNGWKILMEELPKQVFDDGVNYESSIPYHRLVLELFLFPAIYRKTLGLPIPEFYINYIYKMSSFSAACTKPNGLVPVWGDADDARVLPFSFNEINDHRYLVGLVGVGFENKAVFNLFWGPKIELIWFFGFNLLEKFDNTNRNHIESCSFREGGFYVMRDTKNHIFIDCGPLGLANRGGHGHNDLLSFEAFLNNSPLIVDSGSYIYTGNYKERNNFRSTAYHNTPQIDNVEINRFIRWDYLWNLNNDADFATIIWDQNEERTIFKGTHTGFKKISNEIELNRTIVLHHSDSNLFIKDDFVVEESNSIEIPYHFHPDVNLTKVSDYEISCSSGKEHFSFKIFSSENWNVEILPSRVSFSYGKLLNSNKVVLKISNVKKSSVIVGIFSKLDNLDFDLNNVFR